MLGRIACDAGAIYAELESKELREKVVALQGELKVAKGPLTSRSRPGPGPETRARLPSVAKAAG